MEYEKLLFRPLVSDAKRKILNTIFQIVGNLEGLTYKVSEIQPPMYDSVSQGCDRDCALI